MRVVRCLVMSLVVSCVPHAFAQDDAVEPPAIFAEPVPPRPELPEDVAAEVEAMKARIAEMRAAFLKGESESLEEAIDLAERVYEVRKEQQTGWTDVAGNPAEWWEVGDARRSGEQLRRLASLSIEDRAAVVEAETTLENEMVAAYRRGDYAAAVAIAERQLSVMRPVLGNHHQLTLTVINNLGIVLTAQGKLSEAEPYRREALSGARRVLGVDHPLTLTSMNNMGDLLDSQGRLSEAEPYFREALDGRRRVLGEDHQDTVTSINNLGFLLKSQGKLSEAEPYYREALDGRRRGLGDDHPYTLIAINNMGTLLHAQGELSRAESYYRESLEGRRRVLGDEHPSTQSSFNNLGTLLQDQGKLSEAEPYCRKSLQWRRRVLGDEHPMTMNSINNLGALLQAQGNLDEAEAYFREAMECRRRVLGDDHPHSLQSINTVGVVLHAQGNLLEAERYYRAGLEIAQRMRGSGTGGERGRAAKAASFELRELTASLSSLLVQRAAFGEAWTIAEQGRGRALLDLLARSEDDLESQLTDLAPLEAARASETEARVALTVAETRLREAQKEVAAINRDGSLDDGPRAVRLEELDQLVESQHHATLRARRDVREATAAVLFALQEVMPDARPLLVEQIRSKLEPGELLLGYTWNEQCVLLLAATRSEVTGAFVTENKEDTDVLMRDLGVLREALAVRPEGSVTPDTSGLPRRLVPEVVRDRLEASERVIILPDGPLVGIPFEVIADSSMLNGSRQQIVYASSATVYLNRRSMAQTRNRVSESRVVALGDPVFDRSIELASGSERGLDETVAETSLLDIVRFHGGRLSRLPGTHVEVQRIGRLLGDRATVLTGEDANIANLEASVEDARYVHIATHGIVGSQDRPYDASLALTIPETPTPDDIGFLRIEDMIRRWRGKLDQCDLAVLSACDTQRGIKSGTSMMALPWGFFYAGAPTVIASLWQVDDVATSLLMGRMYENLLGVYDVPRTISDDVYAAGEEMSKIDALREAQQWLRELSWDERDELLKDEIYADIPRGVERARPDSSTERAGKPYEHPYYWAAFVLIGDPG